MQFILKQKKKLIDNKSGSQIYKRNKSANILKALKFYKK